MHIWFQSPEGDSLFFYLVAALVKAEDILGFSPPKGIHCFSTWLRRLVRQGKLLVSVPRRGFIVFLLELSAFPGESLEQFQSPEGDSLFFYATV